MDISSSSQIVGEGVNIVGEGVQIVGEGVQIVGEGVQISMYAAINPAQLWHVFSISLARSMHMHATT